MILTLNAIAHLLVDGVCLAALFGAGADTSRLMTAVMLYNTLAFTTQCLVGLWTDHTGLSKKAEPLSMLLVAAGYFLPAPLLVRVAMIGLGNSCFHVCGGTVTLERSGGKASPLGVFVAPGAIGVLLGRSFPRLGHVLAALLILFAAAIFFAYRKDGVRQDTAGPDALKTCALPDYQGDAFPGVAAALLTAAVAVRAIGGSCAEFPWNTGAATAAAMTFFVFAGKTAGGFLCDRIGAVKSSAVSILPAALLTAFLGANMPASLLGQFLLNLSMPVTLWLLYKLMPKEPGLAFGLAASALWPGTLAGMMIKLSGSARVALILISFVFGLAAVLYTVSYLKKGETK
jgi:FSR family fosmidomycin resistance protein-like MFS transporter